MRTRPESLPARKQARGFVAAATIAAAQDFDGILPVEH
jgi:hypothetical protein